jgi:hypothetical protein
MFLDRLRTRQHSQYANNLYMHTLRTEPCTRTAPFHPASPVSLKRMYLLLMLTTLVARKGPSAGVGHTSAANSNSRCTGTTSATGGSCSSAADDPAACAAAASTAASDAASSAVAGRPVSCCLRDGASSAMHFLPLTLMSVLDPVTAILKKLEGSDLHTSISHGT